MDKDPSLCAKASRQSESDSVQLGFVDRRKMFFCIRAKNPHFEKGTRYIHTFAPSFRFAGQIVDIHVSSSPIMEGDQKRICTTIAFKSEVTKANEVSVRSRML